MPAESLALGWERCSLETASRQTDWMSFSLRGHLKQGTGEQNGERVKLAMTGGHVTVIIEYELLPHLQVASQVTLLKSSNSKCCFLSPISHCYSGRGWKADVKAGSVV